MKSYSDGRKIQQDTAQMKMYFPKGKVRENTKHSCNTLQITFPPMCTHWNGYWVIQSPIIVVHLSLGQELIVKASGGLWQGRWGLLLKTVSSCIQVYIWPFKSRQTHWHSSVVVSGSPCEVLPGSWHAAHVWKLWSFQHFSALLGSGPALLGVL